MEVIVREILDKDLEKVYKFLVEKSHLNLDFTTFKDLFSKKLILGSIALEDDNIIGILTTDFKKLPKFDAEGSGWFISDYILSKYSYDIDIIKALYTKCFSQIPQSEITVVNLSIDAYKTEVIKYLLDNGFEFTEDRKLNMQVVWG